MSEPVVVKKLKVEDGSSAPALVESSLPSLSNFKESIKPASEQEDSSFAEFSKNLFDKMVEFHAEISIAGNEAKKQVEEKDNEILSLKNALDLKQSEIMSLCSLILEQAKEIKSLQANQMSAGVITLQSLHSMILEQAKDIAILKENQKINNGEVNAKQETIEPMEDVTM